MCGLVGYVLERERPADPDRLREMLRLVRHRGPDGEGVLLTSRAGAADVHLHTDRSPAPVRARTRHLASAGGTAHDIAIAHTRYAVVDRSPDAHQPWCTPDGHVSVAFQGEVFNHPELRRALESRGVAFRTGSDTEVLAQAFAHWGHECWGRFNGFWAAAVVDAGRRELVLSRDRLGIAPLYVAQEPGRLWFSSSSFALASLVSRPRALDRARTAGFVETGLRDFDERTLFEGVHAFPPGAVLRLAAGRTGLGPPGPQRFWELPDARETCDASLEESAARLRDLLESAVRMRLRGDRPVGFQLSGGLDSAAVVALASGLGSEEVPTYTVSVPEDDEEPLAATMDRLHPLARTVVRGREERLVDELATFTRLMDEPVQAPGAWANHDLCRRMGDDGFGVVLTGSGGDEVLAGYEWDFWPAARREMRRRGRPLDVLRYDVALRYGTPDRARSSIGDWARWVRGLPRRLAGPLAAGRDETGGEEGCVDMACDARRLASIYPTLGWAERRRHHFRRTHLPYYLASNDHATLGIPVEHRQPFLDHRVVEFGLSLPPEHLFHRGWTKYVLRMAMRDLIPDEILWRRKKTGFPFPLRRFLLNHVAELAPLAGRWERWLEAEEATSFQAAAKSDPGRAWRAAAVGAWMEMVLEG